MTSATQTSAKPKADQNVVTGAVVNPAMPLSRVASVDVYRGFVMLLMMGEVVSLETVAQKIAWQ